MKAVIEYEWKGYTPPVGGDMQAAITHAAGIVTTTGPALLADLREELEDAGLRKVGAAVVNRHARGNSRWCPLWREVWRGRGEIVIDHCEPSPRARKARQESAARTRLYQSRQKTKPPEDKLLELARRAERKHPELTTRPMNAAEIVRAGLISINGSPSRFDVKSQSGDATYHVDLEARSCTCYDWHHQAPVVCGGKMCKHRLACLMMQKLREIQPPDPAQIHAEEKRLQALQAGAILI